MINDDYKPVSAVGQTFTKHWADASCPNHSVLQRLTEGLKIKLYIHAHVPVLMKYDNFS